MSIFKRRAASLIIVGAALTAYVGPALAQQPATVQINALDTSTFPTLSVVVSVLDGNGHPIGGLTADDFDVVEDGDITATLVDAQPVVNTDFGVAVVLAIDVSTSMAGPPLDATKAAATAFIESLGPADEVAVVAFSETVWLAQDFTRDGQAASEAVRSLEEVGRTALYDGAFYAVQVASEANVARRVVVLLTDANEFGELSLARRGDAFQAAEQADVPVHTIALGNSVDEVYLEELATLTGGLSLVAPSPDEIAGQYAQLAEQLRGQYLLSVASSVLGDGQQHALTVRLTTNGAQASRLYASLNVTPQVTLEGLEAGQPVAQRITLTPSLAGQGPLSDVTYALDGSPLEGESAPPHSLTLDPHGIVPGTHTLVVQARDVAGNVGRSGYVFEVPPLPPAATLPALIDGAVVEEPVVLQPEIASQTPVRQVTYRLDGEALYTATTAPFAYTLEPADLPGGAHTLEMVVLAESGTAATSAFPFTSRRAPAVLPVVLVAGLLGLLALVGIGIFGMALLARRRKRPPVEKPTEPPAGVEAEAWLVVRRGGEQEGEVVPLGSGRQLMGRSPRCEIVLRDKSRYVSRQHAVIWLQDGRFVVADVGSSRGTYVNGSRLESSHTLSNGDEIRLASYVLTFQQIVYAEDVEETMMEPSVEDSQAGTSVAVKTGALGEDRVPPTRKVRKSR